MTNEELFQDLKQYLDAELGAIHSQMDRIEARVDGVERSMATKSDLVELERRVSAHTDKQVELLDQKLDTITEAIGEAHQASEAKLDDHEHRITRLERMAA